MVKTVGLRNYSDVHYTNADIARRIVEHFNPSGRCLEPFRGDGAFFRHLPESSDWCEIERGLDLAREYGGLKEILHVGTGRQIGFDLGFPFAALHFQRGYQGPIRESHLQAEEAKTLMGQAA